MKTIKFCVIYYFVSWGLDIGIDVVYRIWYCLAAIDYGKFISSPVTSYIDFARHSGAWGAVLMFGALGVICMLFVFIAFGLDNICENWDKIKNYLKHDIRGQFTTIYHKLKHAILRYRVKKRYFAQKEKSLKKNAKIGEMRRPLSSRDIFLITFNCPHCNVELTWRVHEDSWWNEKKRDHKCYYCSKMFIIPFKHYPDKAYYEDRDN